MENVINKLAEIETGTARILEEAGAKKIDLAQELEEKIRLFDREQDAQTTEKLESIRSDCQKKMEQELSDLRSKTSRIISYMDETYQTKHDVLADEIVKQILT